MFKAHLYYNNNSRVLVFFFYFFPAFQRKRGQFTAEPGSQNRHNGAWFGVVFQNPHESKSKTRG